MKTFFTVVILILNLKNAFAMEMGSFEWISSMGTNGPTCPLYRKRVANYYQRISEIEYADRAQKGNFSAAEITRMVELWERSGVQLLNDQTATYKAEVSIGAWSGVILHSPNLTRVKVESPLINWESDRFIFPEEVLKVWINPESKRLMIEFKMQYAQACLRSTDFKISLIRTRSDNTSVIINVYFKMDKFKWDLEQTNRSYDLEDSTKVEIIRNFRDENTKLFSSDSRFAAFDLINSDQMAMAEEGYKFFQTLEYIVPID